jgi:hypothetical protein
MHVLQCSSYTNDQTQRSDSRLAPLHVAGLGDPVMDILVDVDPELLSTVADKAGGCIPIDTAEMSRLLDATTSSSAPLAYVLPHWPVQAAAAANLPLTPVWLSTCLACSLPGGSAANVLKGLANLSAGRLECSFMGMVGKDATAAEYTSKLQQQGVTPRLVVSGLQCLLPHMLNARQRGAAAEPGRNNTPSSRIPGHTAHMLMLHFNPCHSPGNPCVVPVGCGPFCGILAQGCHRMAYTRMSTVPCVQQRNGAW